MLFVDVHPFNLLSHTFKVDIHLKYEQSLKGLFKYNKEEKNTYFVQINIWMRVNKYIKIYKIILRTLWTNNDTKGHMPHEIKMSLEVT